MNGSLHLTQGEKKTIEQKLQHPSLPSVLEQAIESYITQKVGKPWNDPIILERIRSAILAQKATYWKEGKRRTITYRKGYQVFAYLSYQMPVYFLQFQHLFFQLLRDGILPEQMEILDVGTGPGVVPLAIIDMLQRLKKGSVRVHSLEVSEEAIEAYRSLVPAFALGSSIRVEAPLREDLVTIPDARIPYDLDLIVFSNVLNELSGMSMNERASILQRYSAHLKQQGTLLVIEPADRENAIPLRTIVRTATATGDLNLYAPCTFVWGSHCKTERCWSFDTFGMIQPPALMQHLSIGPEGYRYRNTDMKCSYAILRKDGRTRHPVRLPTDAPFLRLSHLGRHVNHRVNVVVSMLSGDIGDTVHHVYLVCDGTTVKPVYAVLPRFHEGRGNIPLVRAEYGDLLEIQNVLVRYNARHDAYNLLVTRQSQVQPYPV
jgi:hypothetical protein